MKEKWGGIFSSFSSYLLKMQIFTFTPVRNIKERRLVGIWKWLGAGGGKGKIRINGVKDGILSKGTGELGEGGVWVNVTCIIYQ